MQVQAGQMQMQAEQMQTHAAHLETSLSGARHRIDELESSKAWRMTAPMRNAGHQLKIARARFRAWRAGVVRLPQLSALAFSILRHEGPGALAQRVKAKVAPEERFKPAAPAQFELEEAIAPLAFAPAAAPLASIVIPVYGKPLLTYTCLKSVHAHTPHDLFEVIVVDDASPEPVEPALAGVTGVRFERNAENLGFIGTCNRGAEFARGEFVVFLNNDTIVTRGWLEALLRVFTRPRRRGPRRRQARLSGRPPAGSRRHRVARRLRVELGPQRRSRPARVQLRARGRLLLGRVPRGSGRPVPQRRRLRRALRARLLRGRRPGVRRARGGTQGVLPAGVRHRALRGADVGHRRDHGRQAAPGREPGHVRRQVGDRTDHASRERRERRNGARPLGASCACSSSTRAC